MVVHLDLKNIHDYCISTKERERSRDGRTCVNITHLLYPFFFLFSQSWRQRLYLSKIRKKMLNQERLSSQSSIYSIILTCWTSMKCQTTCWRYINNIRLYINSVSHVINLPVSQCLIQKNWKQVITTYGISLYKYSKGWGAKDNWGNNETSAVAYVSEAEFQRHTGCPRTHGKAVFGTLAAKVLRRPSVGRQKDCDH